MTEGIRHQALLVLGLELWREYLKLFFFHDADTFIDHFDGKIHHLIDLIFACLDPYDHVAIWVRKLNGVRYQVDENLLDSLHISFDKQIGVNQVEV